MCLAIVKPAKVSIPEQLLKEGWLHNPDGAGFCYVAKKKVVAVKGLMTYKEFLDAYTKAVAKYPASPFLVHFRIRSQGDKSPENTHPFPIKGGMLIHNGTIDGTKSKWGEGPSDTFYFAETFGDKMEYAFIKEHKKDWEDALNYNKVAILYDDAQYLILNEKQGEWLNDVWYSNMSYKPRPAAAPYGGQGPYGMYD